MPRIRDQLEPRWISATVHVTRGREIGRPDAGPIDTVVLAQPAAIQAR